MKLYTACGNPWPRVCGGNSHLDISKILLFTSTHALVNEQLTANFKKDHTDVKLR